ncbi:hypothetical protein [Hydrogenophaga sp.]|uniref:hypothetical protein n=1 Tax=Hydrogenophaga sp. TaxID=1904254 RepID=UPI0025BBA44A|nr:hypothetical protein [Hydrogenophaga sp.]
MLRIRQKSPLSGFHYQAFDAQNALLADLVWPNFAQAKNARLRWYPNDSPDGDVQIRMPQGLYRIGFEYLSRGFLNETRYTLHQGAEPLSVADVMSPLGKLRRQEVHLRHPLAAQLKPAGRWGRVRYRLEQAGQCLGTVEEPRWFSVKRELVVNLPSTLDLPTRLFIGFMTINAAFR